MMKKRLLLLTAILLGGCTPRGSEETPVVPKDEIVEEVNTTVPETEIIANKLFVPWSIQKAQETFYLSERPGNIVEISDGTVTRHKVSFSKTLSTAAEAGFLGFVLHPDFLQNQRAFAYYTYENSSGQYNRIVELVKEKDAWKEIKVLLDQIPSGQYHHGGRLEIGPDGKLYATAGDAATDPQIAQDPKSLGGKILRMNMDGTIPADNPFKDSLVYSYGHRNPQGLVWDSQGDLFASEHGQSAHDEINKIKPGANYGWPVISGDEAKTGMETPLFHSGDETWAPSGMAIHNDKIYVATLRGNAVREFDLTQKTSRSVISGYGRIRDVFIEGDDLNFVSNNTDGRGNRDKDDDKLYRFSLEDIK
jgi:glucose/arabinose dehydrogenase